MKTKGMLGHICDRCNHKIGRYMYLADFYLVAGALGREGQHNIDLCEKCFNELKNTIEKWAKTE